MTLTDAAWVLAVVIFAIVIGSTVWTITDQRKGKKMTPVEPVEPVFEQNGEWFFYAEDWATVYGPFNDEAIARFALHQYCKEGL